MNNQTTLTILEALYEQVTELAADFDNGECVCWSEVRAVFRLRDKLDSDNVYVREFDTFARALTSDWSEEFDFDFARDDSTPVFWWRT